MFLLNSGFTRGKLTVSETIVQKFLTGLTGEEHPGFMRGLLLVLVLVLHLWLGVWLLKPSERPKPPAQLIMEVSLIAMPGQKAEIVPPKPEPPKPEPPKPLPPKKPVVKKPIPKKAPVIPKHVELPKNQTIVENTPFVPAVTAPQVVSQPKATTNVEPKISTGIIPLERVPPKYPMRAASRHIEGWVKVEFTIATDGSVEDAVVVEAEPVEVFDDAALTAINQWKFKEKIVEGIAVKQRAVQTLQFKLSR